MAKSGNFSLNQQVYVIGNDGELFSNKGFISDKFFKLMEAPVNAINSEFNFKTGFAEEKMYFMITSSQAYSNYAKIFLPFDQTTWTMICVTFCFLFGIVVTIRLLSAFIQLLFYGSKTRFSFLNLIAIFLGSSATSWIPRAFYSRFILIFWLLFCLIIRTAYQGVMFDFMTTDMRKPLPKTLDDLITHN